MQPFEDERAQGGAPSVLRPHNPSRVAFHVLAAAFCLGLIAWLPVTALKWVSGAFAATSWSLEITRRISPAWNERLVKMFSAIAHPAERHTLNSSTWYMTALVLLSMTDDRTLCTVGVVVLGVGDPVAALVGRRWGRIRLLYGRTLEGSFAFVVVAGVVAWGMLSWIVPTVAPAHAVALALTGAVAGAVAEVLSRRVDDNLTIPLAAAAAAWLAQWLAQWLARGTPLLPWWSGGG